MTLVMLGNNDLVNNAVVDIVQSELADEIVSIKLDAPPETKNLKYLYHSDLIIIDLTSTDNYSRILIGEIKELAPKSKIILLNIYNQKTLIRQMIDAGASAYLHIDVLHQHLIAAINAVLKNETFIAIE